MQDYIPIQKDINEKLPTVTVKQYDNLSRFIHIQIFDKDLPDLPDDEKYFNLENCTARLYVQPKGDDSGTNVAYIDGEVADDEQGVVTFLLPSSVTETAGNYEGEIWIYGAESSRPIISTKSFDFVVEKSIRNNSAIEGTSKFTALDNVLSSNDLMREQMAELIASPAGSGGDVGTELRDIRIDYDGLTEYDNAGNLVRSKSMKINVLENLCGNLTHKNVDTATFNQIDFYLKSGHKYKFSTEIVPMAFYVYGHPLGVEGNQNNVAIWQRDPTSTVNELVYQATRDFDYLRIRALAESKYYISDITSGLGVLPQKIFDLEGKEAENGINISKSFANIYGTIISNIITGKYIPTNGETVNIENAINDSSYGYAVVYCEPSDVFTITGRAGSVPRLWAFIDDDNNIISKADASSNVSNLKLISPENTTYAIFNFHIDDDYSIKYGESLDERIHDYAVSIEQGSENAGKILSVNSNGKVGLISSEKSNMIDDSVYNGYLFSQTDQQSIPIGENSPSYENFISQNWDTLLSDYSSEISKETVITDSSGQFNIYRYIFKPKYYKRTVFLSAGMHGDEYEGYWGLYRLMRLIYDESWKYPNLRKLRHEIRFVIIPILNPYGMQNKRRANSRGIDANLNYGVFWNDSDYTHTGSAPFSAKETLAVLLTANQYPDIDYYCEFHTDPYSANKGLYMEADANSPTYKSGYALTLDYRAIVKNKYNVTINPDFVVWENSACSSFRYFEKVLHIPADILEVAVGRIAQSGTADIMNASVEWYGNYVANMIALSPKIHGDDTLKIVSQPSDFSGDEGSAVEFEVVVPDSTANYQWQYNNGGAWTNASSSDYNGTQTTNKLIFLATLARNNYMYRCVISTTDGNYNISNVATLNVT